MIIPGCRIILGWDKDVVDVTVMAQTNQAMHVQVIHRADNKVFCCTFVYAGNDPRERRLLWVDLGFHKNVVCGMPWVLLGDFNVALNMENIFTDSSGMNSAICDFKDCVKDIEVVDINSFDIHFTWNQKPKGRDGILKKPDRIMGNLEFIDTFQGAHVLFQPYMISDHSPAVLKIPSLSITKPKPFKFYNFLSRKGNFLEVVDAYCNTSMNGHSMFQVVQKMKKLKNPFRKLLQDQGNLHDRVDRLRTELDKVQKAIDLDPLNSTLLDKEWLEVGDSNSAYFHKSIKSRNQRCRIDVVTTADNVEVTGLSVSDVFVSHYEAFIGWDVVGHGVCNAIHNFFSNGKVLKEINHTLLAFIQGIKEAVSENQSAFVPGRWISDNILITQELVYNYHHNRGPPRCAFKVDIQKAYDTIDWHLLGDFFG
ncbi:hypothetical protein Tco_1466091 [Tanacetum coccineum]